MAQIGRSHNLDADLDQINAQTMTTPFLEGEAIFLRALQATDADTSYPNWLNDGEVCHGNSHHRFPFTREAAREYIGRARSARDELVLAVVQLDGTHIGNVSLKRIDPVFQSAEFAILVGDKSVWGKGYGEQAGRLILDHAFFTLNLHRIYCGTFSNNSGMQRLAEKLGMQIEGRRREAAYKDNRWLDVVEYGVLRKEYVERFGAPELD